MPQLIFAEVGTKKRAVVSVLSRNEKPGPIRDALNRKTETSWVFLDSLDGNEVVIFECDEIYKGFNPSKADDDKYCGTSIVHI